MQDLLHCSGELGGRLVVRFEGDGAGDCIEELFGRLPNRHTHTTGLCLGSAVFSRMREREAQTKDSPCERANFYRSPIEFFGRVRASVLFVAPHRIPHPSPTSTTSHDLG